LIPIQIDSKMALPNIFTHEVSDAIIERINKLDSTTKAKWGTMSVAQMLAHCSVTYEMVYENFHKEPPFFMKLMLKFFVKNYIVNEEPYKHDLRTAPAFVIKEDKNFEVEKSRLIEYIKRTTALGENHFDQKKSLSFGVLSKTEWNNMFWKHLDHHLKQFGV